MINKPQDSASVLPVLMFERYTRFFAACRMERAMSDDVINEPLAREFLHIHDLIAQALGGEDNVPPEIGNKLDDLYNSIVAREKELTVSGSRSDCA